MSSVLIPSFSFAPVPESTNSCMQMRSKAIGRYSAISARPAAPAGSWRSAPRSPTPPSGRRRRASRCRRRSARTRRSCPGSRAAGRSTWAGRSRGRSAARRRSRRRASTTCGRGRNGSMRSDTAIGPAPGPPPPCGCVNVLCRLKWTMSKPMSPGRDDAHHRVQVRAVVVERRRPRRARSSRSPRCCGRTARACSGW